MEERRQKMIHVSEETSKMGKLENYFRKVVGCLIRFQWNILIEQ